LGECCIEVDSDLVACEKELNTLFRDLLQGKGLATFARIKVLGTKAAVKNMENTGRFSVSSL
jgi:hypothetical protein